jgi:hypothetical protein
MFMVMGRWARLMMMMMGVKMGCLVRRGIFRFGRRLGDWAGLLACMATHGSGSFVLGLG